MGKPDWFLGCLWWAKHLQSNLWIFYEWRKEFHILLVSDFNFWDARGIELGTSDLPGFSELTITPTYLGQKSKQITKVCFRFENFCNIRKTVKANLMWLEKYCLSLNNRCLGEAKSTEHATKKSITFLDASWLVK